MSENENISGKEPNNISEANTTGSSEFEDSVDSEESETSVISVARLLREQAICTEVQENSLNTALDNQAAAEASVDAVASCESDEFSDPAAIILLTQAAADDKPSLSEEGLLPLPEVSLDQELEVAEPLFSEQLHLEGKIEAIVFASPKPIKATEITEILLNDGDDVTAKQVEQVLRQLHQRFRERQGGFHLAYLKGEGYQFQTVKAAAPIMERLFSERPRPLSRASLETLSIIAYRQPVTRADVEYIRGVDAGNIIKNLMDRNLVACVGRKEDAGRPMVFGTTDEFLKVFRINNISELPPLSSFQPAPDLIAQAHEMLAQREEMIDVEPYIADMEKPHALVSGGVLAEESSDGLPQETSTESLAGGCLDQDELQGFIGDETLSSLSDQDFAAIGDENLEPTVIEGPPFSLATARPNEDNDSPESLYSIVEHSREQSEEVMEHDGNADSEIVIAAGHCLSSGSGKDDPGGEDLA